VRVAADVKVPLVRGVVAGAVGTGAMSVSEWAHLRLRPEVPGPIDYDVSEHVVIAAARVLHVEARTCRQARFLFLLTHVGYGSAFGLLGEVLARTSLQPAWQTAAFFASTETLALVLFPLLGGTPPPWRWRGEPLIASVVQHGVYTLSAAATRRALRRRTAGVDTMVSG
jgi:uncharacterized membrane protein YagU involved in acid resistance